MILAEINFGPGSPDDKNGSEELAQSYLAALSHSGHFCGECLLAWIKGSLTCHVMIAGVGAAQKKHLSKWGRSELRKLNKAWGREPAWTLLGDHPKKASPSWKAPSLFLFTHAFDTAPPVCRGDTKEPVPTFLLPLSDKEKDNLGGWQHDYVLYDRLWLGSGPMEMAAYKQLAEPRSALSIRGRNLCGAIEQATGKPTFYFLHRYFARKVGEETRCCPSCGGSWRTSEPAGAPFLQFAFRCEPCRLVSNVGCHEHNRRAKIGDFQAC